MIPENRCDLYKVLLYDLELEILPFESKCPLLEDCSSGREVFQHLIVQHLEVLERIPLTYLKFLPISPAVEVSFGVQRTVLVVLKRGLLIQETEPKLHSPNFHTTLTRMGLEAPILQSQSGDSVTSSFSSQRPKEVP
ncbi:hypothetical protein AVEN_195141-1 [Araneus ventricosus]|uniref:Uncharacterized protein n=1 Tax=Araneus ventricosus TaxID=182803 RepID=A0A4Y2BGT4_ARAVE|nr:hypothetical protein AVEN_195141-1 [Araneus ventricosus]